MDDDQGISSAQSAGEQALARAAEKASDALDVAIDVLEDIQKLVSAGPPTTLRVKLGDRTIAEFPLALTAAAAFAAGLAAVLLTKLAIEIEHED